jgi:predicted nucleic acid-binding protein
MPKRNAPRAVFDTSVWVALLEGEDDRAEHVQRLLEAAEAGDLHILVSTLVISEVTKGPKEADPPPMSESDERTFESYLESPFVTLVSVDPAVARLAATIRREHEKLKTPDAVMVATAIVAGAQTLYTYDADDLLPLNGDATIGGLRVLKPPVQHQTTLLLP